MVLLLQANLWYFFVQLSTNTALINDTCVCHRCTVWLYTCRQNRRLMTGCGARPTCLWAHRNLFWQLSRDGNLHGSGMWHAMTASQKLSLRAPLRVGDTTVSREDIFAHARTAYNGLQQKRLEENLCWINLHASCTLSTPTPTPYSSTNDPNGQGTELNAVWTHPEVRV